MGRALGGALAAAMVLLTACGTDTSPTSATDASTSSPEPSSPANPAEPSSDAPSGSADAPSEPPPPTPSAPDGPPFPATTDPQTAEPSGDWDLQLVDVRLGDHDGFDRVVLELTG